MRINRWLNPRHLFLSQLAFFVESSIVTLVFALILMAEHKSCHKAEALNFQVEVLATTLDHTQISRKIHDSLSHSLIPLDMQLELV